MELYKYQGAGNDFLVIDNRDGRIVHGDAIKSTVANTGVSVDGGTENFLSSGRIAQLCDRRYGIGADGLMLLETSGRLDFRMVYYNSDGSGGMMCGNGGRCIVAFAADCGVHNFRFEAADGPHDAEILSASEKSKVVKLKMKDVAGIVRYGKDDQVTGVPEGYFLDTGTRHFVMPVVSMDDYDVFGEGRRIRYMEEFAPAGTNVNFVEPCGGCLHVRTYEKGVEAETYACGTGITASAIAMWHHCGSGEARKSAGIFHDFGAGHVHVDVKALRDRLAVDFSPVEGGAEDVWLTGPATYVCKILL
ncbi:MAG: diaminopimelate epimerase [Bacteroidales bacterium]|nr:diaminopimelate epimerase [Bacteroidales bacterium]